VKRIGKTLRLGGNQREQKKNAERQTLSRDDPSITLREGEGSDTRVGWWKGGVVREQFVSGNLYQEEGERWEDSSSGGTSDLKKTTNLHSQIVRGAECQYEDTRDGGARYN